MLDLELLIRLGRHFNLIANAVINLGFALRGTADDLIGEDGFVDYAVKGAGRAEVLVVDVAVLGGEDADEVSTLGILLAGLSDQITLSHSDCLSHTLVDGCHILLRVLSYVLFNHCKQLSVLGLLGDLIGAAVPR